MLDHDSDAEDTLDWRSGARRFTRSLLAIPYRYASIVALAGGAGRRWGERVTVGIDALDLDAG